MELVSIITPVYNAAETLENCVQSVMAQKASDWELILVDDGSTDGSAALCDTLAARDTRIRVLHQPNAGVSAARNAGLAAALGRFVLFLDSDDALQPRALQLALHAQRAAPGCWVIWRYTLGDAGRDRAFWGEAEAEMQGVTLLNAVSLAWLYNHCFLSMPWNKLYNADVIRTHGLRFDTAYSLGEDLLFCLDYLRALSKECTLPGICLLHEDLTYYRCGESDATLSTKFRADYCALWERIFARLNQECLAWQCPNEDQNALLRAELLILAEGAADLLCRGTDRAAARAALCTDGVKHLCRLLRQKKIYSPYYLPVRFGLAGLTARMAQSHRQGSRLFGRMDWLGWYLLGGKWARA